MNENAQIVFVAGLINVAIVGITLGMDVDLRGWLRVKRPPEPPPPSKPKRTPKPKPPNKPRGGKRK